MVLGKLGYGTCSEVVAHQKPLIYVPRSLFIEQQGLLQNLMKPFGRVLEMSRDEFEKGAWGEYILRAERMRVPDNLIGDRGHEEVVQILERIHSLKGSP